MGLAIFLRKNATPNYFQNIIIDSLKSKSGDEIILCSGFFQENLNGHNYQVSAEANFNATLRQNNIKVTAIGVHTGVWNKAFHDFVTNLRNGRNHTDITGWKITKFKWHAKIFILLKYGKPIMAIVGSSNMTRLAFGTSDFNYEADVILWLDQYKKLDNSIKKHISENSRNAILANYDVDKNGGITIQQRLNDLLNDIHSIPSSDITYF